MPRCPWVSKDPLYIRYHDEEWGKPEFDSLKLFEQLCLEGQQAGLSWITVLKKREAYRAAFHQFYPEKIAQMTEDDIDQCVRNPNLIRHRLKLQAIVKNAKAYLTMTKSGQHFSDFIWSFVQHHQIVHSVPHLTEIPHPIPQAKAMSIALKKRGFAFVGETTCYAFMQAMGLVDDHLNDCYCKAFSSIIPAISD